MKSTVEIERKFIAIKNDELRSLIVNQLVSEKFIEQIYVLPNDLSEVRYRKVLENNKTKYYRTLKEGDGLVREETEDSISETDYHSSTRNIKEKPILKKRITLSINGFQLEVDFFINKELKGLVLIEIEFPSVIEANLFNVDILKGFVEKEVTEDKEYKNKNLWKRINS